MSRRDNTHVFEAVRLYTEPVTAELRAYRAELAAFRAEARADMDRMERKFDEHDRDIAALMRRLYPDDES